ncbi:MAG TPA: 50S ribosomal protein L32 [Atribacter sp.]|jgi:large subunit ribosomal protein L32|uniref:Large ribosomal subunit protein bL32 n=1 Tax=Candidatus Atribacter allofermentans TaxID=1852833 RepID=A0A1V5T0I2_9BACT|nr:50S ribosomal protein L32 [Atribacter sp.]MDD3713520.1 50S ribosomal protein L32 [Atribacterota bacterium]OQA59752.1 MAG: 50S ribosomal protein L32 [Candidatus Atribacteria bacterium ADurb.Bin276]HHT09836.1 50S ribosomal protein L32 [Candidatus Atribacteria bacterium]MDI9593914.1 50S ribosomal protein L32 [Atribacterota bacterium]HOT05821.1 50S ribosomal protein L32 [Atribacter sp.]
MANLTNKTSRSNRDKRRTHWVVKAPNLIECSHCHAFRLSHRVCPACGYYNGKQVIKSKE